MAEQKRRRTERWTLTPEAFDALLARLDSDRSRAGDRYELLRRKLIVFFTANGCAAPETYADESLNRIARRIGDGEEVRDAVSYALGVARLVLREVGKQKRRESEVYEAASHTARPLDETVRLERLDQCVESCLAELSPESRRVVLAYYAGDRRAKIDARRRLAAELGIPVSTLRLRLHRMRARLASCVLARLDDDEVT